MRNLLLLTIVILHGYSAYSQEINYNLIDLPSERNPVSIDTFNIHLKTELSKNTFALVGVITSPRSVSHRPSQ